MRAARRPDDSWSSSAMRPATTVTIAVLLVGLVAAFVLAIVVGGPGG